MYHQQTHGPSPVVGSNSNLTPVHASAQLWTVRHGPKLHLDHLAYSDCKNQGHSRPFESAEERANNKRLFVSPSLESCGLERQQQSWLTARRSSRR